MRDVEDAAGRISRLLFDGSIQELVGGTMYQGNMVPFDVPRCGRYTASELEACNGSVCPHVARPPAVKTGEG